MGMFINAEVQSSPQVMKKFFEKLEKQSNDNSDMFTEIEFSKVSDYEMCLSESSSYGMGGSLTYLVDDIVKELSTEFPFSAIVVNVYDDGADALPDGNEGLGWSRIVVNNENVAVMNLGFGNFGKRFGWNVERDGTVVAREDEDDEEPSVGHGHY